jgi:hypothetical protein
MNMNVIITIAGREAIPIRAIPYITGWMMSHYDVAVVLTQKRLWSKFEVVVAYQLSEDDQFSRMLPREWVVIEADLAIRSATLKAKEEIDRESFPAWRRETILLVPSACFVWKDDFEKVFKLTYSQRHPPIQYESPGDRELNFSPYIPEELKVAVMQGFKVIATPTLDPRSEIPPIETGMFALSQVETIEAESFGASHDATTSMASQAFSNVPPEVGTDAEPKQSEPVPEICDLFDAISKVEIAAMFEQVTKDKWKSYFERAARNGLSDARQGDAKPRKYNPAKVADWLVSKGRYARDYADRKLANCIPKRSRDYKYLITGKMD